LFGVRLISTHEAGMIGVTLGMLGLLYLFFRGSRLGLAMRAAAANPDSARLVGIRVGWMIALGVPSPSLPWRACSACRPPATMLGVLASLQHAPSPMMRCSDDCARSMLSRAALMVHLEFMPSCVPKVGPSARIGLHG
jgi:hypothetical protein